LGPGDSVAFRVGQQPWNLVTVPPEQTRRPVTIAAGGDVREFTLAGPGTGRGVRLKLSGKKVDRIWLIADAERATAHVFIAHHAFELAGKDKLTFATRIEPLSAIPGLPSPPPPAETHARHSIVVEECMVGVGRSGTWGDIVHDELADDLFAAKLYNTHYEWCMQWRIDPALFEPNTPYRVRIRARVEKGDREGEAFWAGVYDAARKEGVGQIAPTTAEAKDGYQWYDVTTWTPEEGQFIWVGPGQFDKKSGESSAIKAVFIDRFELLRAVE